MTELIACLSQGKIVLIQSGHAPAELESPYLEQSGAREEAIGRKRRVVGLTRGRVSGEICYATSTGAVSALFAQKPGTRDEQRLFHSADVLLAEIDFSFADEAFTCTVDSKADASAIGILADDGKGVRTVTEGDVLDRAPRWVPGGVGEIVYASAGIGRTRSGARAGRSPFALHRLRLNDSTVEVLVSDAKNDYLAPVPVTDSLIYAIRRRYEAPNEKRSPFGALAAWIGGSGRREAGNTERLLANEGHELVRITPKGSELVAPAALAFDVALNGDIVYSTGSALYRVGETKGSKRELVVELDRVEQLVIC